MVEKAAEDYAKFFQNANFDKRINPMCSHIDDMLARLDEFETLLTNVKSETTGIMQDHVIGILGFEEQFKVLRERIDNLEEFVEMVNADMNEIEKSVDIAEEELNVTDYSLRGLILKPLLAKAKASVTPSGSSAGGNGTTPTPRTNLKDGEYQRVPTFKTSDFFDSPSTVTKGNASSSGTMRS